MSTNRHATGCAGLCAPSLLAFVVAAMVGLAGGPARAEELKIVSPPMMDVITVNVDVVPATDPVNAAPAAEPATAAAVAHVVEEPPVPKVVARVDLSEQTMTVYVDERLSYVFKVSTGRSGYGTPTGQWYAQWLSPRHRSKKYHNAPMPWSVFFNGGYAIHGTTEVRRLGRPASHGCVRLLTANAKIFYQLVQENGMQNTLVSIVR